MTDIPKDVAERLYKRYAATLINPVPLDEMVLDNGVGFRAIYEKGIVKPGEQLFWIWHAHKKNADLSEPYDVGVLNALALAMYIFSDKEHLFWEKPESRRSVIEACDEAIEALKEWQKDEQKIYSEKLTAMAAAHATEIDRLKKEISDLRSQQKVVIEDDKS